MFSAALGNAHEQLGAAKNYIMAYLWTYLAAEKGGVTATKNKIPL
jgi:TPR repeat protein